MDGDSTFTLYVHNQSHEQAQVKLLQISCIFDFKRNLVLLKTSELEHLQLN